MVHPKVVGDLDFCEDQFGARDISFFTGTFKYLNIDNFLFSNLNFPNATVSDSYCCSTYLVISFLSKQG